MKGLGNVKLNDIVVFNYPAGDTLCNEERYQANDYYQMVYSIGDQILEQNGQQQDVRVLNPLQQRRYFEKVYAAGTKLHRRVCRANMATSSAVLPTAARTT